MAQRIGPGKYGLDVWGGMSNLRFVFRRAVLTVSVVVLASSALVACRPTDDTASESVEATSTAAAAKTKAKVAKPEREAPRPYELDPAYPLEDLASGATPSWPAPAARQDGAPITLRAVRTDGEVVVWGYGNAPATSLAFDIRFLDDAGILRDENHQGQPVSGDAGKWFRVGRVGKTEWSRAQVQLTEATITRGGAEAKWEPTAGFGRPDWRYGYPEKATSETGDSGVGFAVVGRERHGGGKPGQLEGVLIVALHNGGTVPLERVQFELVARDGNGATEPSGGVWVPSLGDTPEPVVAPGAWTFVEVDVKGDPARVLAASDFTMKVTAVERAK